MGDSWLSPCYRLIGQLLLHPRDREADAIDGLREQLDGAPAVVRESLDEFLACPAAASDAEYVSTLELSPPCPLYLGTYLFDEPTTCRDVGMSGRNAYMLELTGLYRHFGFDIAGGELPDFLPVVVDFLWISASHRERDRIGLRRRLLEHHVQAALEPIRERLEKYQSPYAGLLSVLQLAVEEDLRLLGDTPAWQPPPDLQEKVIAQPPCMQGADRFPARPETEPSREEVRP